MKRTLLLALFVLLTLVLIPAAVKAAYTPKSEKAPENFTDQSVEEPKNDESKTHTEGEAISVFMSDSKKAVSMSMRDYVIGALAAEMPAAYEEQALKAQALASVTLARYQKQKGKTDGQNGEIVADPATHQGYMSIETMRERFGDDFNLYYGKLCAAVDEVLPYVLTYQGEIAVAAFHAISSGVTEASANVWSGDIPYLRGVVSEGDRLSPGYSSEKTVTKDELKALNGNIKWDEKGKLTVKDAVYTDAGLLKSVSVGGVLLTGEQLRQAFSLRSANITAENREGELHLTVHGYGHGVGMSQYGADYYARQGYTWQEIIAHYYPGCEISKYNE